MGPPVQEELTTYHPSDDFEYIKKSNAYKEFVKNCEKDWSSYYKENGNIDLALHELKPIRGKVKSLGGKKPATPDGPYVCRKDFNGHETDCRYDPDGDGRYAYYLEAAWVCSFEGL